MLGNDPSVRNGMVMSHLDPVFLYMSFLRPEYVFAIQFQEMGAKIAD